MFIEYTITSCRGLLNTRLVDIILYYYYFIFAVSNSFKRFLEFIRAATRENQPKRFHQIYGIRNNSDSVTIIYIIMFNDDITMLL